MKKIILVIAAAIATLASAQVLEISSITKVKLPSTMHDNRVAGISPDGSYIVLTNMANQGLTKFNLSTGKTSTLSTAPRAGMGVRIIDNGTRIVYRESSLDKNHHWSDNVLVKNMRIPLLRRKLLSHASNVEYLPMPNKGLETVAYVSQDLQLMVSINGKTRTLSPQGTDRRYIWAELSPDKTKISYYCSEEGGFVCDLQGNVLSSMGRDCRAAKWLDNNTIVGHDYHSDGQHIISGAITVRSLDGRFQTLTNEQMTALYPVASNGKIAFSTLEGEVYIINVK